MEMSSRRAAVAAVHRPFEACPIGQVLQSSCAGSGHNAAVMLSAGGLDAIEWTCHGDVGGAAVSNTQTARFLDGLAEAYVSPVSPHDQQHLPPNFLARAWQAKSASCTAIRTILESRKKRRRQHRNATAWPVVEPTSARRSCRIAAPHRSGTSQRLGCGQSTGRTAPFPGTGVASRTLPNGWLAGISSSAAPITLRGS
jgi:hypothetical protein